MVNLFWGRGFFFFFFGPKCSFHTLSKAILGNILLVFYIWHFFFLVMKYENSLNICHFALGTVRQPVHIYKFVLDVTQGNNEYTSTQGQQRQQQPCLHLQRKFCLEYFIYVQCSHVLSTNRGKKTKMYFMININLIQSINLCN